MLSKDPYKGELANPLSLHPYLYSYNDPINLYDPNGMSPLEIGDDLFSLLDGIGNLFDMHPYGGVIKAAYEAVKGKDLLTDKKLTGTQRAEAAADLVPGMGMGKAAKRAGVTKGNSWKPGDPNDALTRGGKYPSWETAKKRHWKNRANSSSQDEFSPENLDRMKQGKPPLHDEVGVPQEMHHKNGRKIPNPHNSNNLEKLWPWEHDAVDPLRHYRCPRPKGE